MNRKVIEWGHDSLAMTLPIKWARLNNISKGDEIQVILADEKLTICPKNMVLKKKEITLNLSGEIRSNIRLNIANAYRVGYDVIHIVADKQNKDFISEINEKILIGFEFFEHEKSFTLESMVEPSYEDYPNLITKLFFIIEQLFFTRLKKTSKELSQKVQKYDNFIKRSISKQDYVLESKNYYWQFLSQLSKIARNFYYLDSYLEESKTKLSKNEEQLLSKVKKIFEKAKLFYLKKDLSKIEFIHNDKISIDQEYLFHKGDFDNAVFHYLMLIVYNIYHLTSPISGIIQNQKILKN